MFTWAKLNLRELGPSNIWGMGENIKGPCRRGSRAKFSIGAIYARSITHAYMRTTCEDSSSRPHCPTEGPFLLPPTTLFVRDLIRVFSQSVKLGLCIWSIWLAMFRSVIWHEAFKILISNSTKRTNQILPNPNQVSESPRTV